MFVFYTLGLIFKTEFSVPVDFSCINCTVHGNINSFFFFFTLAKHLKLFLGLEEVHCRCFDLLLVCISKSKNCPNRISAKTVSMCEIVQLWTDCGKFFQEVKR